MKKVIFKTCSIFLLLFSLVLFSCSMYYIYSWHHQNKLIDYQLDKINDVIKINKTKNVVIESDSSDTKQTELIDVDFSELKKMNEDVVGFIDVKGTNIYYPFVQGSDNSFYLNHSFDKSLNDAGWVFQDYRNDSFNDKNIIIYAHSRLDKTMFGSLKNTLKKEWFNNKDNHLIRLSTENVNTIWEVFSIYHIPTTDDYLKVKFTSDNDFSEYIKMVKNRSIYEFNTNVLNNDKILTLSTCYRNNEKLVLHAKLVKMQLKQ